MMKRLLTVGLILVVVACQREDSAIYVNPSFVDPLAGEDTAIEKIAVLPFSSAVHQADDPDGLAKEMMGRLFGARLNEREDYHFVSPNTVLYAMERAQLTESLEAFLVSYAKDGEPDIEFLTQAATALKVDAFLIPVVYQWEKDEVDYREDATPTTYVGATVTIIDVKNEPGLLLFKVTNEDYLEGARSETASRSTTSTSGILRSDAGGRVHRAPAFDPVATRVVDALVMALPAR